MHACSLTGTCTHAWEAACGRGSAGGRARQTRLWVSKHIFGANERSTLKGAWHGWRTHHIANRHQSDSERLEREKKQLEEKLARSAQAEEHLRKALESARTANADLQRTIARMQAQLDAHEQSTLRLADEYGATARKEAAKWAEKVKRRDAIAAQLTRQAGALWRANAALLAHVDRACTRRSIAAEKLPRISLLAKGADPSAGVLRRTVSVRGEELLVRDMVKDLPVDLVLKRWIAYHTRSHEEICVKNFGSHLRSAHALAVVAHSIGALQPHGATLTDLMAIADNDVRAMAVCDILSSLDLEHVPRGRDLSAEAADSNARLVAGLFLAMPALPAAPAQLGVWQDLRDALGSLCSVANDELAELSADDASDSGGVLPQSGSFARRSLDGVPMSPSAAAAEAATARAEQFEAETRRTLQVCPPAIDPPFYDAQTHAYHKDTPVWPDCARAMQAHTCRTTGQRMRMGAHTHGILRSIDAPTGGGHTLARRYASLARLLLSGTLGFVTSPESGEPQSW